MISRSLPVIGSVPFLVPTWLKKQPETRKPERSTSNRQKHQLPTRRATATSRHSRARPESLECGPTSLPRGSWNVMPAATRKLSSNFPRNDAETSHPSGSTGPANSYTVHSTQKHPSRCTGRKIHHDVRNLSAARRLVASDAGSQSNRTSKHVASSRVGALCQGVGWSLCVEYR